MHFKSIAEIQQDLAAGRTTSVALTQAALQRAQEPNGEGKRVYLRLYAEQALQAARASDQLRAAGVVVSPLAGIPISIKDLLDVKGEPTTGASAVLADAKPATTDAVVLQRLRRAGAIIVGRTNMPQFAYSGVGQNPHHGTPRNPFERDPSDIAKGRASGGSSSGAAISITDGMAVAAIGSDTGGSIRIPAALCGLAGAYISVVYTPLWVEGMVAGKGWIALALTTFATWRPARVLLGAYLFGGVTMLQFHLQGEGVQIPSQWLSMLPYLATIVVLVLISRNAMWIRINMPASLGKPFFPGS